MKISPPNPTTSLPPLILTIKKNKKIQKNYNPHDTEDRDHFLTSMMIFSKSTTSPANVVRLLSLMPTSCWNRLKEHCHTNTTPKPKQQGLLLIEAKYPFYNMPKYWKSRCYHQYNMLTLFCTMSHHY